MWDFDHGALPSHLKKLFRYSSEIHGYGTRSSSNAKLAKNKNRVIMLKFIGPKVLNSLKILEFYNLIRTKKTFRIQVQKLSA